MHQGWAGFHTGPAESAFLDFAMNTLSSELERVLPAGIGTLPAADAFAGQG
jgi:hypothetical protein